MIDWRLVAGQHRAGLETLPGSESLPPSAAGRALLASANGMTDRASGLRHRFILLKKSRRDRSRGYSASGRLAHSSSAVAENPTGQHGPPDEGLAAAAVGARNASQMGDALAAT